jgi:hypothetical protein
VADKFNSASRVADVLLNASSQPPSLRVLDVWCRVFGITVNDDFRQTDEVIQGLKLLLSEVELVKAQVDSGKYGNPARYGSILAHINQATNKVNFGVQWEKNRQHLDGLEYDLLGVLSDLTPDEERVQEDALADFAEELQEFKQYAIDNLEGQFQIFVVEQISIMERAIRSYPIVGAKAFRVGEAELVSNLIANQDVYENSKNQEAKVRLKERIKVFLSLAPEWVVRGAQVINAADTIREITGG